MKLCKDCMYAIPDMSGSFEFARCHLSMQLQSLVTGVTKNDFCEVARMEGKFCGPDGYGFEQREVQAAE